MTLQYPFSSVQQKYSQTPLRQHRGVLPSLRHQRYHQVKQLRPTTTLFAPALTPLRRQRQPVSAAPAWWQDEAVVIDLQPDL
jgi:hypothetical protein